MAFVFKCNQCGGTTYTQKGFNANRTMKRLVCKSCGKTNTVPLAEFDGTTNTVSSTNVNVAAAPVTAPTTTVTSGQPAWNAVPGTVNVKNAEMLTADINNERKEPEDPDVAKNRVLCINGVSGIYPNMTHDMIVKYSERLGYKMELNKEGVYILTAKPADKG